MRAKSAGVVGRTGAIGRKLFAASPELDFVAVFAVVNFSAGCFGVVVTEDNAALGCKVAALFVCVAVDVTEIILASGEVLECGHR